MSMVLLPYGFTLFSNAGGAGSDGLSFYYLMDLHYSQTVVRVHGKSVSFTTLWIYTILKLLRRHRPKGHCFTTLWIYTILKQLICRCPAIFVLLPYGFTLFSNKPFGLKSNCQFYYLMDLHYSQTNDTAITICNSFTTLWIYTILKLCCTMKTTTIVLLPYGFTLFSNHWNALIIPRPVLLPYGFTLFSNDIFLLLLQHLVLLPYGFTLFSNPSALSSSFSFSFTTLWIYTILKHYAAFYMEPPQFYYLMDLHYSQTYIPARPFIYVLLPYGFTLFSNSFSWHCTHFSVLLPYGFTLFSN